MKPCSPRSGASLLLAMVVLAVLGMGLTLVVEIARAHRDAAAAEGRDARALAAAEAALDLARALVDRDGPFAGAREFAFPAAQCRARARESGGRRELVAEGEAVDLRGRSGWRIVETRAPRGGGWVAVDRREERLP